MFNHMEITDDNVYRHILGILNWKTHEWYCPTGDYYEKPYETDLTVRLYAINEVHAKRAITLLHDYINSNNIDGDDSLSSLNPLLFDLLYEIYETIMYYTYHLQPSEENPNKYCLYRWFIGKNTLNSKHINMTPDNMTPDNMTPDEFVDYYEAKLSKYTNRIITLLTTANTLSKTYDFIWESTAELWKIVDDEFDICIMRWMGIIVKIIDYDVNLYVIICYIYNSLQSYAYNKVLKEFVGMAISCTYSMDEFKLIILTGRDIVDKYKYIDNINFTRVQYAYHAYDIAKKLRKLVKKVELYKRNNIDILSWDFNELLCDDPY